jgi:hypothetical protein
VTCRPWYRRQPCSPCSPPLPGPQRCNTRWPESLPVRCGGRGTVRRPSKSIVVFVLAHALKSVLVVFHAQRIEQRATHLLSARTFVRWTGDLSRSDNLF